MTFKELLASEFRQILELSPQQLDLLEQHYRLLLSWNRRLNLTRIIDLVEAVRLHYCESLFLGTVLPPGGFSVADLGSGAGFPGVPLAVLRPELGVTLMESDQRKAVFLRESARGLKNVEVFSGRFEDYPGHFEWAVSRAVAPAELLKSAIFSNLALLTSNAEHGSGEVVKLPWGKDRAISVSRGTVSRGTSS